MGLLIDRACVRYGRRPSELIGIPQGDSIAIDFDLAIMLRGLYDENDKTRAARIRRGNGGPGKLNKARGLLLERLK